jgi:fructuronate reductase
MAGQVSRLDSTTAARLPARLRPRARPSEVGIVHFGLGAFHRAHQAPFTEEAMELAGGGWGICGVTPRGSPPAARLAAQDGLYTVLEHGTDSVRARVVGVLCEIRSGATELEHVVARIASPSTHVITVTVTERGYLGADRGAAVPIAQLAAGLQARAQAGAGPVTVVCCDNLLDNGEAMRRSVEAHLRAAGDERVPRHVLDWVADNVRFPSTVVDRITPARTSDDVAEARSLLGIDDDAPVVTEPYRQWVIQDAFAGPRPAWELAGATMTGDVVPYETLKLRILNGTHSAIAYLGGLAGHETIADAVADDDVAAVSDRLMREDIAPTLSLPEHLDLPAYQRSVLERFGNAALRHTTHQVAGDGSQKLAVRLVPVLRQQLLEAAQLPPWVTLAIAAWMRYVTAGLTDTGARIVVADPLRDEIGAIADSAHDARSLVIGLLGLVDVFGDDLPECPGLVGSLTEWLEALTMDGVQSTLRRALVQNCV